MKVLVLLAVVVGCGGSPKHTVPFEVHAKHTIPPPPADEAGIRAMLGAQPEVLDGGLWFADPICRARFAKPRHVAQTEFDGFAKCLAALAWTPGPRGSVHDDTAVLVTPQGFEIEANAPDGKLKFIGFAGRGARVPELPQITPVALEALRTAGAIYPDQKKGGAIRVCLDETGAVARVDPMTRAGVVADWTFKPFTVGDEAIAACAVVSLADHADDVVPLPSEIVAAQMLEGWRIAGTKMIVPTDEDKVRVHRSGHRKIIGAFKLCLDETGTPERATILKTTGLPGYDLLIARTMLETWRYRPYEVDREPVAVCTAVTFIYSQK